MTDNAVENYGWSSAQPAHSCAYLTPVVVSILKKLGSKRILDIGSGNGALCSALAGAGFQVAGIEHDQHGVEIARRSAPSIPFYAYGVADEPSALLERERPFDTVVSTEVIEHLFSPHLLPIYAHAVLEARGHLVVTTPYHGYLKNLLLSIAGKWDFHHTPLWHGGHIKFWSRATLSRLLAEHGFRVVAFVGVGRCPFLWKSMVLIGERI
jgi:2-polyprenyl-3-methyl-5-hydroxy-6-metoxy-1,4-benzoquinol methylase